MAIYKSVANRILVEDPDLPGRPYEELCELPLIQWTREDWMKMRVPCCRYCMEGPWEIYPFGATQGGYCQHGYTLTMDQLAPAQAALRSKEMVTLVILAVGVLFFSFADPVSLVLTVPGLGLFIGYILLRMWLNHRQEHDLWMRAYFLGLPWLWVPDITGAGRIY